MKTIKTITFSIVAMLSAATVFFVGCDKAKQSSNTPVAPAKGQLVKILVWNIQNGMWSDQGNNYDDFVTWVRSYKPDVCIWCEARSNYQTGSKTAMPKDQCYLPDGWGELAKRYGHEHWAKSGQRDNFPQVITSKYPVQTVSKILGNGADTVVSHGSGHYQIKINERVINFVSLHTWPQKYAFGVSGTQAQEQSTANAGGDYHRLKEITYICEHTIGKAADPQKEWWFMAGDFNSQSSLDNDQYQYSWNDTRFLVHDYVLNNTPYIDAIKEKNKGEFKTTTSGKNRVDYAYCSPEMMKNVTYADVVQDWWTASIIKDEKTGFKKPSDHRPLFINVRVY